MSVITINSNHSRFSLSTYSFSLLKKNKQTILLLAFLFLGTFMANAQFVDCKDNNNGQPPAGPPLGADNTWVIDATNLDVIPANNKFCFNRKFLCCQS